MKRIGQFPPEVKDVDRVTNILKLSGIDAGMSIV